MAMKFFKEAKVSTGTYTNKSGEEKKSYTKIGALFMDQETGNMALKLDVIPMPSLDNQGKLGCWISFFDKYEDRQQSQGTQQAPQQQQGFQQQPPANSFQPQQQQGGFAQQPQQAFQGNNDGIPY